MAASVPAAAVPTAADAAGIGLGCSVGQQAVGMEPLGAGVSPDAEHVAARLSQVPYVTADVGEAPLPPLPHSSTSISYAVCYPEQPSCRTSELAASAGPQPVAAGSAREAGGDAAACATCAAGSAATPASGSSSSLSPAGYGTYSQLYMEHTDTAAAGGDAGGGAECHAAAVPSAASATSASDGVLASARRDTAALAPAAALHTEPPIAALSGRITAPSGRVSSHESSTRRPRLRLLNRRKQVMALEVRVSSMSDLSVAVPVGVSAEGTAATTCSGATCEGSTRAERACAGLRRLKGGVHTSVTLASKLARARHLRMARVVPDAATTAATALAPASKSTAPSCVFHSATIASRQGVSKLVLPMHHWLCPTRTAWPGLSEESRAQTPSSPQLGVQSFEADEREAYHPELAEAKRKQALEAHHAHALKLAMGRFYEYTPSSPFCVTTVIQQSERQGNKAAATARGPAFAFHSRDLSRAYTHSLMCTPSQPC